MNASSSSPPPWLSSAFTGLREACASGKLVLFAGDGVSAAAGLPDQRELAWLLAGHARERVTPERFQLIERRLAARRYMSAFSALQAELGATSVPVIARALDADLADEPEVARAIAALAPQLRAVFSSSIDSLLEDAFAGRWPTLWARTSTVPSEPFLYKLRGTLLEPESWIFSHWQHKHDLLARRRREDAWKRFFREAPVLFVGHDLNDDAFLRILARLHDFAGKRPLRHFAFVPEGTLSARRQERLEALGVRLIPYDGSGGRSTGLVEWLERLAAPEDQGPREATSTSGSWRERACELLTRAGFTVSRGPPDSLRSRSRQAVHFKWLMRSLDMACTSIWLSRRMEQGAEPGGPPLEAVLTRSSAEGFAVALHEEALSSGRALLAELARVLTSRGVAVRVYGTESPGAPLPSGVEALGLKQVLASRVGEPLRAHARRCLSAWSEAAESRFEAARARFPVTGAVLPVPEALARTLAERGRVLLLGDYGTGKSTHLRRFAARLAKDFLENPERTPAVLLLPLAGMPLDLDAVVSTHVPGLPRLALRLAVELGLVVVLLDGLDEMAWEASSAELLLRFWGQVFAQGAARAVFSSRTNLFSGPAPVRQGALLGVSSRALLDLEPLDGQEVQALVTRWVPSEVGRARIRERLRGSAQLEALAQRPALLALLVENRELSTTRLFALATEAWLDSRKGQERRVSRERQYAFARRLARALFSERTDRFWRRYLMEYVRSSLWEEDVPEDVALFEFRRAGFLGHSALALQAVSPGEDESKAVEALDRSERWFEVRLPHGAFLEYFLAMELREALASGELDTLELPPLREGVVSFLLELEGGLPGKALLREVLTTGYQPRVSENALRLLYLEARARVGEGEALGRVLEEELPTGARLEGARLEDDHLPWLSLREARLSGAVLMGACLDFADLRGARIDWARADYVHLDGALLDGASFEGTKLVGASMVDASLAGVDWTGADVDARVMLEEGPGAPPRAVLHGRLGEGRICIAWAPDRRRVASGHAGGSARIWDARRGQQVLRLEGVQGTGAVAFSPDSLRLASEGADGTVKVWDARGGALLHRLEVHASPVRKVVFSPGGEHLAIGCEDGTVEVWDARGGTQRYGLKGPAHRAESVVFSPDGARLACGCEDGAVKVWEARSGVLLLRLEGHAGRVGTVAIANNGVRLASGSADGTVRLWDVRDGTPLHRWEVGAGAVHSVSFSTTGRAVAAGCEDGTVAVWDAASGEGEGQWRGHVGPVRTVRFMPGGRDSLASGGGDGSVWWWEASSTGRQHRLLEGEGKVTSLEFSPDGTRLAAGFLGDGVKVWDVTRAEPRYTMEARERGPSRMALSPDGERLACLTGDDAVSVWDVREGVLLYRLEGYSDWVDGEGSSPDDVAEWDARGVALLHELEDPTRTWEPVVLSPDGERRFSLVEDGLVRGSGTRAGTPALLLASTKEGWVAQVEGTPFLASGGDTSTLVHYVAGSSVMSAALWRPLFHRPDLVREALAGRPVDVAAQGLGDYAACVSALRTERRRLGLERRRGGLLPP